MDYEAGKVYKVTIAGHEETWQVVAIQKIFTFNKSIVLSFTNSLSPELTIDFLLLCWALYRLNLCRNILATYPAVALL